MWSPESSFRCTARRLSKIYFEINGGPELTKQHDMVRGGPRGRDGLNDEGTREKHEFDMNGCIEQTEKKARARSAS